MNLFRSEEHVRRWPLYYRMVDDYVMPVRDWAVVLSVSLFRNRLDPDFLSRSEEYLDDYRRALQAMGKTVPAADRVLLTVMFTDIVDSTRQASRMGDDVWRSLLERHNQIVRDQLGHFEGREVKQTGDGFMATFTSPARAIRCATRIREIVGRTGLSVRAGIHSGECEILGNDIGGIAVHITARITSLAGPGEVLISQTVRDAVIGSQMAFEERGMHELKGVPGTWQLYAASAGDDRIGPTS